MIIGHRASRCAAARTAWKDGRSRCAGCVLREARRGPAHAHAAHTHTAYRHTHAVLAGTRAFAVVALHRLALYELYELYEQARTTVCARRSRMMRSCGWSPSMPAPPIRLAASPATATAVSVAYCLASATSDPRVTDCAGSKGQSSNEAAHAHERMAHTLIRQVPVPGTVPMHPP